MGINIAGGADITVIQPLLNFLQAHAVGVKQACAAMAQVVEADENATQINAAISINVLLHKTRFSE